VNAVSQGGVLAVRIESFWLELIRHSDQEEYAVADKIVKEKKENVIQRYFRETVGELRKVNWPTPREAWHLTRIVLLVLAAMSFVLGALDFLFSKIIELIVV
jgi:preprotein translocase subunit SecE